MAYQPETGALVWLVRRGRAKAGQVAGTPDQHGYNIVVIDRKHYKAHRLAWLLQTGEWPAGDIDHINGDPSDNRWSNLRLCSHGQNMQNRRGFSATGYKKGAYLEKRTGRWFSTIRYDGKREYLGMFDSEDAAHEAYCKAAKQYHKEFAYAKSP